VCVCKWSQIYALITRSNEFPSLALCLVSEIVCSGWIVTAWLDTVATDLTPSLSLLHALLYLPAHLLLNLLETVYLNPPETQQFNFVL
jgi:hypothetical protein